MRHRGLAAGLVAFLVLGTLGLAWIYEDWGAARDRPPIRIAVDVWVGFAPLYLAEDLGLFQKHGVEVRLEKMKGAEEIRAGLASGSLDGQTTSLDTVIQQGAQGIRTTTVIALDRSAGGDGIVATRELRSVASLRGREVAFQPATPSHFFLMFHLDRAGMTLADVMPRFMDSGDAGAAFVAGRIDAAVTWEPWLTRAAERPDTHVLASTAGNDVVIVDVLAFRPDVLKVRGNEVRAIAAAWDEAVRYWQANPEDANRRMAAHYGLAPEVFAEMLTGLRFLDMDANQRFLGTLDARGPVADLVESINRILVRNGIIDTAQAVADVVALDYLTDGGTP